MARIDELRESTQAIMAKPVSTGGARDGQMRQLLANSVEASALVHDEVVDLRSSLGEFKEYVEDYGKKADRFAITGRIIAFGSLAVAIIAVVFGVWSTLQANKSDRQWQQAQLQLLETIHKDLNR